MSAPVWSILLGVLAGFVFERLFRSSGRKRVPGGLSSGGLVQRGKVTEVCRPTPSPRPAAPPPKQPPTPPPDTDLVLLIGMNAVRGALRQDFETMKLTRPMGDGKRSGAYRAVLLAEEVMRDHGWEGEVAG